MLRDFNCFAIDCKSACMGEMNSSKYFAFLTALFVKKECHEYKQTNSQTKAT